MEFVVASYPLLASKHHYMHLKGGGYVYDKRPPTSSLKNLRLRTNNSTMDVKLSRGAFDANCEVGVLAVFV
jgi:hypothetical protein